MNARLQQGAAYGPPLLDTKRITKLTDAASELFRASYDLERIHKQAVKDRLAKVLLGLDLFGPYEHYYSHEDYQPSDGGLG